jgi:hypothetical protein
MDGIWRGEGGIQEAKELAPIWVRTACLMRGTRFRHRSAKLRRLRIDAETTGVATKQRL